MICLNLTIRPECVLNITDDPDFGETEYQAVNYDIQEMPTTDRDW